MQFIFIVCQVEVYRNILKLSCRRLAFNSFKFFLKGGLELISLAHFLYDFWRKIFILLSAITWPDFIAWLPLLHEILGNISIVIVCWPGFDVINFQTDLVFLIKPFFYMTKTSRQKFKHLENKKSFSDKIESIFHHF